MWKFWVPIFAIMTAMETEFPLLHAACKYYFEVLSARLQAIRQSEAPPFEKICLLFATSIDYRQDADAAGKFFAAAQRKFQCTMGQREADPLWIESQAQLNRILSRLFDIADLQTQQRNPMHMQAWTELLHGLLALNDSDLQQHHGLQGVENLAHCLQAHGKQPGLVAIQQNPAVNAEYGRAPKRHQQKASLD
jgi:hypothetical protein